MPREIKVKFGATTPVQSIGFWDENDATTLIVDVNNVLETNPLALFSFIGKRQDGYVWPMSKWLMPDEEGLISYTFTAKDLQVAGNFFVEVQARENSIKLKSGIYSFRISSTLYDRSINNMHTPNISCHPSPPRPPFVDEILDLLGNLPSASGIEDIQIDEQGRLIFLMSDGREIVTEPLLNWMTEPDFMTLWNSIIKEK